MTLTFRNAREDDLDRLVDIHVAAFPDARTAPARLRNFRENPLGELADLRVAEERGIVVAHAFLFSLEAWFGGALVRVGGLASLGVAVEARGRGVGRALVEHCHAEAHARHDAITLLYAFRQAFYGSLGYGAVTPTRRLRVAPAAIPAEWSAASGDRLGPGVRVRSATGSDRPAIESVYRAAARAATGRLERPPILWDRAFTDERRTWILAEGEGGVVHGYVTFTVRQAEAHARTNAIVHELVADGDVPRHALLGALRRLRDQVSVLDLEIDDADPLPWVLVDADAHDFGTHDLEHPLGVLSGGPMVRIVTPTLALLARGYATIGAVDLHLPDWTEPLRLTVGATEEGLRPNLDRSAPAPEVRTDAGTLAAIAYGGLRPSQAARLGRLEGDPAGLAAAEALFAGAPFFSLDPF